MSKIRNYNRILAMVALVATVFVMLVSTVFIVEHASHRCDDEAHCPVCALIQQCQNNIKNIGAGLIVAATVYMVVYAMKETGAYVSNESIQTSLVSQKVRIDS